MLSEQEKTKIIEITKKYNSTSTFLFGSSIDGEKDNYDIDIGVEGIAKGKFFYLYAELMKNLSKPVDLIDLGKKSKINDMIKKNGIKIYG